MWRCARVTRCIVYLGRFHITMNPSGSRARECATFDGCSLDMTRYECSGDRDKRIEWAERDETMDRRSTSRNTIASASRRIVCLALISALDSFPRRGRDGFFLFPKIISNPPPRSFSFSFFPFLPSSPLSFFLPLCIVSGEILFVINLAKVTLITTEFYLSCLTSNCKVALL